MWGLLVLVVGLLGWRAWQWDRFEARWNAEVGTLMHPHPTRLWGLKPGVLDQEQTVARIDDHGLREPALGGGDKVLLTLGDSVVFGHNVGEADTLHRGLVTALKAQGHGVDVHCGAVPGYSSAQSLQLLREEGPRIAPDLVVLSGLWNDAMFSAQPDRTWMSELLPTGEAGSLARLLWRARVFLSPPVGEASFQAVRYLAPGADARSASRLRPGGHPQAGSVRRVSVQEFAANLDAMLTWAAEHGAGAVVLMPANTERLEGGPGQERWQAYLSAQRAVARHRKVPLVDARDALRAAGLSSEQAFLNGVHPTGRGHAAIARGIAIALVEAGWPDTALVPDAAVGLFNGSRLGDGFRAPPR
jgi:lysophospholipase L1-like esterase